MFTAAPPMPSSPSASRVLVVGDCSVGKTLMLHMLTGLLNNGKAEVPRERVESTIGYHVQAAAMRSTAGPSSTNAAGGGTPRVIEFVEIGGSRSLMSARGRYAPLAGSLTGILFVYNAHSTASAISVSEWYTELRDAGVLEGCKAIALVGVDLKRTGGGRVDDGGVDDPFLHSNGAGVEMPHPSRAMSDTSPRVPAWKLVWAILEDPSRALLPTSRQHPSSLLRVFLSIVRCLLLLERVFLYLCSLVLFGVRQTHVVVWQLPVDKALALVQRDGKCVAVVHNLPLADAAEFADCIEELFPFFGLV